MNNFLFVGEERSALAVKMQVTWVDGRLAAKQLFDALKLAGIDPKTCEFVNLFEGRKLTMIRRRAATLRVVAMGKKVQRALSKAGIPHVAIVHPAARGTIRLKSNYAAHVRAALIQ